ncbi:MAG: hypothetical protein WD628_01195, partial [Thermomicrobiales bacterium]
MQAYGMTGRLAAVCGRRPWTVIAVWVVLFVVAIGVTVVFPASLTTDAEFTNRPEAYRADELLDERMESRDEPEPTEYVVIASGSLTIDDPAFQSFVEALTGEIAGLDDYVGRVTNYYAVGDERLVADDRRATILPVYVDNFDSSADR